MSGINFHLRLKEAMEKVQMRQVELSEKSGLTRQTINSYCAGKTTPDIDNLEILARALNVSTDYLLGISDSEGHFRNKGQAVSILLSVQKALPGTEFIFQDDQVFMKIEDPVAKEFFKRYIHMESIIESIDGPAKEYGKSMMESALAEMIRSASDVPVPYEADKTGG